MSNWSTIPRDYYTNLGTSGLKISKIIIGLMSFGKESFAPGVVADKEKVFAVLKKAYDSGIRTFDTADCYSNGHSELLLGEFLKTYKIKRDKVVILTKLNFPVDDETPGYSILTMRKFPGHEYINSQGLSRKHILDAAKGSMERLGTYSDVTQIHHYDPTTPMEETMEALHDIIKEGYTRYIGASNVKAYQFVMMQSIAEKKGWTKFISIQNYYSALHREEEHEMNAYCKENGVSMIPYSSNARGLLCRSLEANLKAIESGAILGLPMIGITKLSEADKEIINRVEKLSEKHETTMAAISSAYLLAKGANPIVGISKAERIDDILKALKVKLTDEDVKFLEEPYVPRPPRL